MTARRVWVNTAITREAYYRRDETQTAPKPPTRGTPPDTLRDFIVRPEWFADAACRGMGPDMFFPERVNEPGRLADPSGPAKRVCAKCSVVAECAAYIAQQPTPIALYGVWGGMSAGGRRKQRRRGAA